jgi:hypothetical protein
MRDADGADDVSYLVWPRDCTCGGSSRCSNSSKALCKVQGATASYDICALPYHVVSSV